MMRLLTVETVLAIDELAIRTEVVPETGEDEAFRKDLLLDIRTSCVMTATAVTARARLAQSRDDDGIHSTLSGDKIEENLFSHGEALDERTRVEGDRTRNATGSLPCDIALGEHLRPKPSALAREIKDERARQVSTALRIASQHKSVVVHDGR